MLPLPAATVSDIIQRLRTVKFKQLYGAFEGKDITQNADEIVRRSGEKIYFLPQINRQFIHQPDSGR